MAENASARLLKRATLTGVTSKDAVLSDTSIPFACAHTFTVGPWGMLLPRLTRTVFPDTTVARTVQNHPYGLPSDARPPSALSSAMKFDPFSSFLMRLSENEPYSASRARRHAMPVQDRLTHNRPRWIKRSANSEVGVRIRFEEPPSESQSSSVLTERLVGAHSWCAVAFVVRGEDCVRSPS